MIFIDAYSIHSLGIISNVAAIGKSVREKIIVNGYQSDERLGACLADLGIEYITSKYTDLRKHTLENISLIVSIFGRRIIPNWLLNKSRLGGINIHPSLLPRHRGCFAIPWSIIEGDQETGLTIHTMEEEIDTGYLLYQESWKINSDDTAFSLHSKFLSKAFSRYPNILSKYILGEIDLDKCKKLYPTEKSHPRQLPHQGIINKTWSSESIERFIRAMYYPPFPPATYKNQPIYNLDQLSRIS